VRLLPARDDAAPMAWCLQESAQGGRRFDGRRGLALQGNQGGRLRQVSGQVSGKFRLLDDDHVDPLLFGQMAKLSELVANQRLINIGSSFQPETRPDRVSGPDLNPDPTANWTRTRPEPERHFSDPKPEMPKTSYPKMDPKINLP